MAKESFPKKLGLTLLRWLAYFLAALAISVVLQIAFTGAFQGWPLFFRTPEAEEVRRVTIVQASTGERREMASPGQDLELAVNLLGNFRYVPFSQGEGEPAYTVSYLLTDGRRLEVGVNETSVFYEGKSHRQRGASLPWNILEGYYF